MADSGAQRPYTPALNSFGGRVARNRTSVECLGSECDPEGVRCCQQNRYRSSKLKSWLPRNAVFQLFLSNLVNVFWEPTLDANRRASTTPGRIDLIHDRPSNRFARVLAAFEMFQLLATPPRALSRPYRDRDLLTALRKIRLLK